MFGLVFVCGKRFVDVLTLCCIYAGMEVGAYLCDKAASVSCIDITAVPFERVLGERIGKTLQNVCIIVSLSLSLFLYLVGLAP